MVGEVHAGLDGDAVPGGEDVGGRPSSRRGCSWITSPMPWPVPWMKASPQPASCDHLAAGAVDVDAPDARPAPRRRRRPATRRTTSSIRCWVVVRLADHAACGSCRSGSRRRWRRSRSPPARRRRDEPMTRSVGRAWGLAPFGPLATMVSNDGAVGAVVGHGVLELAPELRSVRPSWSRCRTSASAASAIWARRVRAGRPRPSSFTARWSSTTLLGGHEVGPREGVDGPAALCRPRHVVGLEADAGRCPRARRQRARARVVGDRRCRPRRPRRSSCSAAWSRYRPSVTKVSVVGVDQQRGVGSGEPGEVADVDEVGHDEGVAPLGGEARRAGARTRPAISSGRAGRQRPSSSNSATASTASR